MRRIASFSTTPPPELLGAHYLGMGEEFRP
jgi:hypothetical protein